MAPDDTSKRFHHTGVAYRFTHNTLEKHAQFFEDRVKNQAESGERDGISLNITAALVFTAFTVEANVNFVGWKKFENAWPERANFFEKVELLNHVLGTELDWGTRPLQTLKKLKRIRDTLAHGKPDVETIDRFVDGEPDMWAGLRHDWEDSVTPEFLSVCREDSAALWQTLLEAANIQHFDTMTQVEDELKVLGRS